MRVTLEWYEVLMCAVNAVVQKCLALASGQGQAPVAEDRGGLNRWHREIEGKCAEAAVAKSLGMFWMGQISMAGIRARHEDRQDVGEFQVRWTVHSDGGLMMCRFRDVKYPESQIFILVTGEAPTFELRGWCYKSDRKPEHWRKDWRVPNYCIPQNELRPISELINDDRHRFHCDSQQPTRPDRSFPGTLGA